MVSVLASSAIERGFDARSCQTKDYNIGMCSFSAKHALLRRKIQIARCLIIFLFPFYSVNVCLHFVSKTLPPLGQIPRKVVPKYGKSGLFKVTFNNISAISWRPVLVVAKAGVPGENHRSRASNW
jgi:hypothetical protein